jgi:hypothetical protein
MIMIMIPIFPNNTLTLESNIGLLNTSLSALYLADWFAVGRPLGKSRISVNMKTI